MNLIKSKSFLRNINVFLLILVEIWIQRFVNSQIISEKCVNIILKNLKYQYRAQQLSSNSTIYNNILKYKDEASKVNESDFYDCDYIKNNEYVLDIVELMLSKNEDITDAFWDAMMESYPPTWHVYGLKPTSISIIKTRFMESCASNILTLLREGIVVKYHTIVPSLRDVRYLTLNKIIEICNTIKDKMMLEGFELYEGPIPISRSDLLPFNRCLNRHNDDLADIILLTFDDKYNSNLTKSKVCSMVDNISKDPRLFNKTCIESLKLNLFGFIPSKLNIWNEVTSLCELVENIRQLTITFDENVTTISSKSMSNFPEDNLKQIILGYFRVAYKDLILSEIGKEITSSIFIKERRFLESCVNFVETLVMTKGLELMIPNSEIHRVSWSENIKMMYRKMIFKLRSKFLITCSSIHMHLLKTRPKGISVSLIEGSKILTRSNLSTLLNSETLVYDSCENKYIYKRGNLEITQDTMAEMIITIISYSSQTSQSSIALNNGVTKRPICELSGLMINFLNQSDGDVFEDSFILNCKKIIFSNISQERVNSTLRKSTVKLCNIISSTIQKILQLREKNEDFESMELQQFIEPV